MDLGGNLLAAFGLIASSFIAIVANSLLLVVFCRRRGLRTISNRFIINLLFTNVLSSILLLPTFILDSHLLDNNASAIFTQSQFQRANYTSVNNNNPSTIIFTSQQEDTEIIQNSSKDITILEESQEEIIIDSPQQQQLEVIEATVNHSLTFRGENDKVICFVSEFVVTLICTACIFSVLLIGVDQFFAVLYPLRYQSYINKTRSVILVLLTWFVSMLFGVGSALTDANLHYFRSCQGRHISSTWTIAFAVCYLIIAIIVPFVTICSIYVCIYSAAHKNSVRVRKVTSMNFPISPPPTTTLKKTHSAPNFSQYEAEEAAAVQQHLHDPLHLFKVKICRTSSDRLAVTGKPTVACRKDLFGGSRNLLGQIRHKLSNTSVFRYREESRTAKISLLVIFMVLLGYGPYGVSLVLNAINVCAATTTIYRFNTLSLILLITSNVISPFLFAYRNRRIQRELGKFLRIIPPNSLRRRHRNPLPNIVIQRNSEGNPHTDNSDNCKTFPCVDGVANSAANGCNVTEPFLVDNTCDNSNSNVVNIESDLFEANETPIQKKSILKRVCSSKSWNYKKCSFITVPDSCLDARGSFSSASTQVSTEEC